MRLLVCDLMVLAAIWMWTRAQERSCGLGALRARYHTRASRSPNLSILYPEPYVSLPYPEGFGPEDV